MTDLQRQQEIATARNAICPDYHNEAMTAASWEAFQYFWGFWQAANKADMIGVICAMEDALEACKRNSMMKGVQAAEAYADAGKVVYLNKKEV